MDCIDLAQHRGQWRTLVNTVMKLLAGTSWAEEQLSASQGLCSMSYFVRNCIFFILASMC
jgi:hypothetical protein